jgi:hypothetical protein
MLTLKVVGQVDESHRLTAAVPDSIRPGQVEIVLIVSAGVEDEAEAAWMRGVAHEWRDELNDSREDIYTLADGEPVDGSR